jgi:hypothetical protein
MFPCCLVSRKTLVGRFEILGLHPLTPYAGNKKKGRRLITASNRVAVAGLSAAALVIGLMGCDSTPGPPTDVPPSVPKEVVSTGTTPGGRKATKSIKNRPGTAVPIPPASNP